MGVGRKPLPSHIRLLQGNPGHRPINKNEPKPEAGLPPCPKVLVGEARKEWRRMGRRLADMGVLTQIDRAALAAYCSAWARWCEAEGEIRKHGLLIKTPNNYPAQNPYLAIANRAQEIMLKVAVEFGMTPSSRTRIKVNGGSEEENQGGIRGFIDGRPKD